jgi:hypothetical protein
MSDKSCMYTANGFLICDTKGQNIIEKFSVCPSGTWKQKCNLECNSGIMKGTCQGQANVTLPIKPFDSSNCKGKDIYFDVGSNALKC